jgi:zinc transport system permease protein
VGAMIDMLINTLSEMLINTLSEMFSYNFLVRAVVVGLLVSLCAALLGVSLVLKRYSMIGDGLSHVGFATLAIATAMNAAPLMVSIPIVVLAAFLLLRISENSKIKGDAAIALISTSSLAIGVVVISLTTGMNTDVCNYMFGSILAMSRDDVSLSIVLAIVVLGLFVLFYNKIFAVTFDENFAKATGLKTNLYNMLIAFLTAIMIVLGMRMMGALLISSLIIFPALTSMRLCKKFKSVTICSAVVSVICFFIGVVISYIGFPVQQGHQMIIKSMPTGASVVIVNIVAFLLFCAASFIKGKGHKMKKIFSLTAVVMFVFLVGCSARESTGRSEQPSSPTPSTAQSAFASPSDTPPVQNKAEQSGAVENGEQPSSPTPSTAQSAFASPSDTSPSQNKAEQSGAVEIKEKLFIAQLNDIYLNPDEYMGKTIKYEGMFIQYHWDETNMTYYLVYRNSPGCCGTDGQAGFEVVWPEESDQTYPAENEWCEVVGTLATYEENGQIYMLITLDSLMVKSERGAEFVSQ